MATKTRKTKPQKQLNNNNTANLAESRLSTRPENMLNNAK